MLLVTLFTYSPWSLQNPLLANPFLSPLLTLHVLQLTQCSHPYLPCHTMSPDPQSQRIIRPSFCPQAA